MAPVLKIGGLVNSGIRGFESHLFLQTKGVIMIDERLVNIINIGDMSSKEIADVLQAYYANDTTSDLYCLIFWGIAVISLVFGFCYFRWAEKEERKSHDDQRVRT